MKKGFFCNVDFLDFCQPNTALPHPQENSCSPYYSPKEAKGIIQKEKLLMQLGERSLQQLVLHGPVFRQRPIWSLNYIG